ncbi:hypothetical protein DFJ74DRAFT_683179 [Hyaloraphidium curvatum]|nr:hypothetical protein DFJ74DRAFT_683179 [Hyaloraphidium curvatum]
MHVARRGKERRLGTLTAVAHHQPALAGEPAQLGAVLPPARGGEVPLHREPGALCRVREVAHREADEGRPRVEQQAARGAENGAVRADEAEADRGAGEGGRGEHDEVVVGVLVRVRGGRGGFGIVRVGGEEVQIGEGALFDAVELAVREPDALDDLVLRAVGEVAVSVVVLDDGGQEDGQGRGGHAEALARREADGRGRVGVLGRRLREVLLLVVPRGEVHRGLFPAHCLSPQGQESHREIAVVRRALVLVLVVARRHRDRLEHCPVERLGEHPGVQVAVARRRVRHVPMAIGAGLLGDRDDRLAGRGGGGGDQRAERRGDEMRAHRRVGRVGGAEAAAGKRCGQKNSARTSAAARPGQRTLACGRSSPVAAVDARPFSESNRP